MAYYIFLKSLTSLEEFRKNPHIKIPPKSPCANFQALVNSKKIQFLIRKFFFLILARPPPLFFFQPSRGPLPPSRSGPVGQNLSVFATCPILLLVPFLHFKTCPIRPLRPQATTRARPTWPTRPKPRWRICRKAYSLRLCALWQRHLLSLTSLPCGARLQLHPLPPPPADRCHSSPPATPRRPASNLEMPGKVFTPCLDFPLNFTP
jgi:hypothetical protein